MQDAVTQGANPAAKFEVDATILDHTVVSENDAVISTILSYYQGE